MNAQTPVRGTHLVDAGRRLSAGAGWIARLVAGGFARVIDRIDAGLDHGSLLARLPDGSERLLGARAPGPDAQIELVNWNAILRLATGGSVGWYQAWEAGEWNSPDPVQIFALFMRNADVLGRVARAKGPWRLAGRAFNLVRRNHRKGARRNIAAHYDLGNDFYAAWLDPTMSYSSAMFDGGGDLAKAQILKMERLVERLKLRPGASVLEIGCGWGALASRIADEPEVRVEAISLSDEQLGWARQRHGALNPRLAFQHRDYRDVSGQFDGVVSVEMVEAVGKQYWPEFFDCLSRCLRPGGRAALQFISIRDSLFDAYAASADFIQTYVFPGGMLIRESAFRQLAAQRGLSWQDEVRFGADYAETLRVWREAFDRAVDEGRLPAGFDARFVRLWRYYLMYCEGGFRGGGIDVAQVTLVRT
ncbi:class I SAM-dependent methyltransferase [Novosphingobium tardum]|uniref:Class I SAM-dependent methyltransferase n=1 Tax=Novosphingobium tardum TaxID=1538021 RepID=A0ABV8RRF1_9SPHN